MSAAERPQPDMWARLVGQEAVVRSLREALERDAVGHAYVFAGPQGVGRTLAALALAASLNCPDGGCGSCEVCRKVLREAHFDVTVVEPEGPQILVTQVRAIREGAYRSPVEGRVKVFIVQDAERMNPAAANALLKVLEEPPGDVVFLLLTAAPDDLPATILSRCRRIDFSPLGPAVVRRVLVEHHGVPSERAAWAARVASDLSRALRLVKSPDAEAYRRSHLELPWRLASGGPAAAVAALRDVREEVAAALEHLKRDQHAEAGSQAETIGQGRGSAGMRKQLEERHKRQSRRRELLVYEGILEDLATFYRDLVLLASGVDASAMVNTELAGRLREAAGSAPASVLLGALSRIEATRRSLARNVAAQLALESLFLHLGAVPLSVAARA